MGESVVTRPDPEQYLTERQGRPYVTPRARLEIITDCDAFHGATVAGLLASMATDTPLLPLPWETVHDVFRRAFAMLHEESA